MKRTYARPQLSKLGLLRAMTKFSDYTIPSTPSDPPSTPMPGLYGNGSPSTDTPPTDPSTGLPLPGIF